MSNSKDLLAAKAAVAREFQTTPDRIFIEIDRTNPRSIIVNFQESMKRPDVHDRAKVAAIENLPEKYRGYAVDIV